MNIELILDYPVRKEIDNELLEITGQLCVNNGTECFQELKYLSDCDSVMYICQQSFSRIIIKTSNDTYDVEVPSGCVCIGQT